MKILSYKKIKSNLYELSLDNDTKINLYDEIILKENLLVKKIIEESYLNELIGQNNFYELYHLAIKFMKTKMRCEKEIYQKFNKRYSNNEIAKVIERLRKDGYLNDLLYITSYINDVVNLKLIGPDKIKKDLISLGLDSYEIDKSLVLVGEAVWNEKVKKYADKMIKNNKKLSASLLKQKIVNDLITKGFGKDIVLSYLDTIRINISNEVYEKEYNKLYNKLSKKYEGDRLNYEINMRLRAKGFYEE